MYKQDTEWFAGFKSAEHNFNNTIDILISLNSVSNEMRAMREIDESQFLDTYCKSDSFKAGYSDFVYNKKIRLGVKKEPEQWHIVSL
jgi:hypothetical protein